MSRLSKPYPHKQQASKRRYFEKKTTFHFQHNSTPKVSFQELISQNKLIEGSLEVKLPTIWTDEKQSREEAERRERLAERRVEEKE
jgi:hypothetical protein